MVEEGDIGDDPANMQATDTKGVNNAMAIIMSSAIAVGIIAFLVGFIGSIIFFPSNNLGPILGIFITGPAGFLLGAVIGLFWLIIDKTRVISAIEWKTLLCIWLVSTVWYFLFCQLFGLMVILTVVVFQLLIVFGIASLYWWRGKEIQKSTKRRILLFLFCAVLIVGTEVFPPVSHPSWATPKDGYLQELPLVAFVGDGRLNASRKVPQLAIDRQRLLIVWLAISSVSGIAWVLNTHCNPSDE